MNIPEFKGFEISSSFNGFMPKVRSLKISKGYKMQEVKKSSATEHEHNTISTSEVEKGELVYDDQFLTIRRFNREIELTAYASHEKHNVALFTEQGSLYTTAQEVA